MYSVSEARKQLLAAFSPLDIESIAIEDAHGRVLAREVASPFNLPLFANSSMDGYAVRAQDIARAQPERPVTLKVVADIPAGKLADQPVGEMQAARIMTGAPVPPGADAVIPVEDTDQYQDGRNPYKPAPEQVGVYRAVASGAYVRPAGEDIHQGEVVLPAGRRLRPQDLGLLAMLGIQEVEVRRKPKVAIISTGDELIPLAAPLTPGKIHDSNAYTLSASIRRDGADPLYLGIARDDEAAVEALLERSVELEVDLILSSAGVSVGAFDFVRAVVEKHGRLNFWKVNMRPGKPLAFGQYRGIPFAGLPGNPVSAYVGYEVFIRSAIRSMLGHGGEERRSVTVTLDEPVESDGRESYLRGVARQEAGEWRARLTGHQGSGNLLSLVQANALLIIPSGVKSLPSGEQVQAWLLEEE